MKGFQSFLPCFRPVARTHSHLLLSVSTQADISLAYVKRRNEWTRLCAIVEFITGDDCASLGASRNGLCEARKLHQLFRER